LSLILSQNVYASEASNSWSCKNISLEKTSLELKNLKTSQKNIVDSASASAIIVHGLNGSPYNMSSLVKAATKLNMNTYHVFLRGHRGSLEEFKKVTKDQWIEDIFRGYCQLKTLGKPIVYIGYSLGGLLGPYFLEYQTNVSFQAMILLAPGIVVKPKVRLLRFFRLFGKEWIIPRRGPDKYYANRGTPVQAWLESFSMMDFLESSQGSKLSIPTLVAVDPKDKLISYKKLKKFVATRNLNKKWSFLEVHSTSKNHHLVFNRDSLENNEWGSVIDEITKMRDEVVD